MAGALAGKVAVVTGSGQGVGRGIALLLAREGARVVTNDLPGARSAFMATSLPGGQAPFDDDERRRHSELAGAEGDTVAAITAEGGEAVHVPADVTDPDAASALVQAAVDTFGRIDVLVNNAAALGFGPFVDLEPADWRRLLGAKLDGTFHCMRAAVPHMVAQSSGRILNASSDAWTGIASLSAYAAANAGVVALTVSTAKELAAHGITVNAYCPQAASPGHLGFRATLRTMLAESGRDIRIDPERMEASERAHGPAENLTFLAYLASDAAAHISGATFSVTGDGQIALYSTPTQTARLTSDGSPWTVERLAEVVPEQLLADHRPIAEQREF